MKRILTIFDTSGIQDYIFATSKLSHHVAASHLVEKASDEWLRQALQTACGANFWFDADPDKTNCADILTRKAELIYSGGGNAVLLFDTLDRAIATTRQLTATLLTQAPGLNIQVAHTEFDCAHESLNETYKKTLGKLAQKKMDNPPAMPMTGQSVAALCSFTNQPATSSERKNGRLRYLSASIQAKRIATDDARRKMKEEFLSNYQNYKFTSDLDEFGEYDEHGDKQEGHSYLAVVHADGNGMGQRKKNLGDKNGLPAQNCDWIKNMRLFSKELNEAGLNAFRAVVEEAVVRHGKQKNGVAFLFSPIIYGGDDTTFVCDGYQGLWLAKTYLEEFEKQCNATTLLKDGRACAGVAITKTHFPFIQAYQMAADLCQNAKQRARDKAGSYLDWHFGVNGSVRRLAAIRKREYETPAGKLHLRPVSISKEQSSDLQSWAVFEANVNAFRKEWGNKRGKLKELRGVLREGGDAVKEYMKMYETGKSLPESAHIPGNEYTQTGWQGGRCVYFDAIEAYDHFDGGKTEQGGQNK